MSRKHSNISIFVPHIGCPNKCSFCNQRYITGVCKGPGAEDVGAAAAAAQSSKGYDPATTEIQFAPKTTYQYMADRCEKLGVKVPSDYVAIEVEK